MQFSGPTELVQRAQRLLWIIVMCDVENLSAQRHRALCHLRDLEAQLPDFRLNDLYEEILLSPDFSGSE